MNRSTLSEEQYINFDKTIYEFWNQRIRKTLVKIDPYSGIALAPNDRASERKTYKFILNIACRWYLERNDAHSSIHPFIHSFINNNMKIN